MTKRRIGKGLKPAPVTLPGHEGLNAPESRFRSEVIAALGGEERSPMANTHVIGQTSNIVLGMIRGDDPYHEAEYQEENNPNLTTDVWAAGGYRTVRGTPEQINILRNCRRIGGCSNELSVCMEHGCRAPVRFRKNWREWAATILEWAFWATVGCLLFSVVYEGFKAATNG